MNKVWVLLICLTCVSALLGGCHGFAKKSRVDVIVEGEGDFPEELAGTWRADKQGWEIVLEPDGKISSAVISLGRIRLEPGKTTKVPMIRDGEGIFTPGDWLVHYNPANRELTVKLTLEKFRAVSGDQIIEGKSTDVFAGPISQDGKSWQVDWTGFPDYTAHTEENPNFKLTSEESGEGIANSFIFEKITQQ